MGKTMTIKFETIKARNFLSIKDEVTFHIQNGIDIVTAKNGSGKSAIFIDIIHFALFGETHRSINQKQIVNRDVKKACMVEVTFSIDEHSYRVERGLNPNVFNVYKNNEVITNLPSLRENQKLLDDIISLNKTVFNNICLLNIDFTKKWLQMSMKEKTDLILYITDYTFFKNVKTNATNILTNLTNEISKVSYKMNTLNEQKETYQQKMNEIQKENDDIKTALINEIQELETKLNAMKAENDLKQQKLQEYQTLEMNVMTMKRQIGMKIDDIKSVKEIECPKCGETFHLKNIDEMKKECNDEIERYNEINNQYKTMKEEIKALIENNEYETLTQMYHRKRTELQTLEQLSFNHLNFEKGIQNVEQQVNELNDTLTPLETKKNNIEQILKILKSDKIRTYLVNQLNTFNRIINNTYSIFDNSNECKIVIDSNFDIRIDKNGNDINANTFSSGEKAKLSFAILLSFIKYLEYKNNCNMNIIVLDEILDAALDYDGKEMLLQYFQTIENKNIVIISHNDDVMNVGDIFNRRYTVINNNGTKLREMQ